MPNAPAPAQVPPSSSCTAWEERGRTGCRPSTAWAARGPAGTTGSTWGGATPTLPATAPSTASRTCTRLLTEIGGGGPYLLVGHSYGGLLAEMYAATYPAEVSGLVLVDATLTLETTLDPPSTVPAVKAEMNDNGENLDAYEGYAQARRLEADLPDIPVTYILAEEMDLPAEWSPREYRRRVVAWIDSLPRGELVSCPCDHHIPRSAPALIAQTIQHLADEGGAAEGAGLHDIGDRELLLDCRGTGSPTVILEPGQGDSRSDFEGIQDVLAATSTACTYDRANVGQSGTAPTPRTSLDVVEDLHALLEAADAAPPYVLAGTSAGGFFAMHFARANPDEVIGVLAMNPPPLATDWVSGPSPAVGRGESPKRRRSYRGDNPESYDWSTSGQQLASAPAPDAPARSPPLDRRPMRRGDRGLLEDRRPISRARRGVRRGSGPAAASRRLTSCTPSTSPTRRRWSESSKSWRRSEDRVIGEEPSRYAPAPASARMRAHDRIDCGDLGGGDAPEASVGPAVDHRRARPVDVRPLYRPGGGVRHDLLRGAGARPGHDGCVRRLPAAGQPDRLAFLRDGPVGRLDRAVGVVQLSLAAHRRRGRLVHRLELDRRPLLLRRGLPVVPDREVWSRPGGAGFSG